MSSKKAVSVKLKSCIRYTDILYVSYLSKTILFKAKFNKEEMGLKMISTTLTFNNINSIEKKIYGTYRIGTISTIISLYITEHKQTLPLQQCSTNLIVYHS